MSDVSDSLKLLTKNEQIADLFIICSKNEQFAQKTDEQIPNPAIETPFPCLYNCTVGSW